MTAEEWNVKLNERLNASSWAKWNGIIKDTMAEAIAEEREACAKIADSIPHDGGCSHADDISLAIRHRGS